MSTGRIVNQRELSEVFGVSHQTMARWTDEGMPALTRGERGQENQYDTAAVIEWYAARAVAKGDREDQKERLARLQGDKIEMELAASRGELIPAAQVEPAWSSIVTAVRQALLPLGTRLAQLLESTPGVDAKRALIDEEVHDVLLKLSNHELDGADEPGASSPGEVHAAEEGASQPMG